MFTGLFGPSLFLMILDLFLDNPDDMMNLREISRRLERNPGSIIRVLPKLVDQEYVVFDEIGKNRRVYRLNKDNPYIIEFQTLRERLAQTLEDEQ